MSTQREEKALFEFKHVIDDVVQLLRKSTEADTVYMYWVNRSRKQFVLETSSTILSNVMFEDRVNFENHYLDDYKEIRQPKQLKVDDEVKSAQLSHYHGHVPARFLTLLPFVNNDDTVALTVIETEYQINLSDYEEIFSAYRNALVNVLNTYLELTDLYEGQQEWTDYEESMNKISTKMHKVEILDVLVEEIQRILPTGGVSVVARGMECWVNVLKSKNSSESPSLGLLVEEKTMAYDALQKGEPQFSIHFNQNPKRISSSESDTDGATLAIPLIINDRRHAVILAHDRNPLVFKESTKHKIQNLVRMASLSMQVNLGKVPVDQDIFTSEFGNFIPDLWEASLKKLIMRAGNSSSEAIFGFVTVENVTELRSKLRLESLKRLQRTIINQLNPSIRGFNGFVGFSSDYIYPFILISDNDQALPEWIKSIQMQFENPVELVDGQKVTVRLQSAMIKVTSDDTTVHDLITRAKKQLSEAVKNNVKFASNF